MIIILATQNGESILKTWSGSKFVDCFFIYSIPMDHGKSDKLNVTLCIMNNSSHDQIFSGCFSL